MSEEASRRPGFRRETTDGAGDTIAMHAMPSSKNLSAVEETGLGGLSEDAPQKDQPSEDVQAGVQDVEAVTLTWTKTSLVAVFILYVHSHLDPRFEAKPTWPS